VTPQKAEVAARIKSARAEKGWKQKHLAAEVKVEPITVSRWERGATTPDFDALALIAEATGKPLSYFLGDDEQAAARALGEFPGRHCRPDRVTITAHPEVTDAKAKLSGG
jgi:transcriptional regulator with XRE-family HTH domain